VIDGPEHFCVATRLLQLGADDVVGPRCTLDEAVARVVALARRLDRAALAGTGRVVNGGALVPTGKRAFGPITMDCEKFVVRVGREALSLPRLEFMFLLVLVEAKGRVVTRQELAERLYPRKVQEEPGELAPVLGVLVCRVRDRLEAVQAKIAIITRYGVGYGLQIAGKPAR
jgi:DNA-binding response OmpR family regulator